MLQMLHTQLSGDLSACLSLSAGNHLSGCVWLALVLQENYK